MKEKKDWGLILAIVAIILFSLFIIGSIGYQIHEDNKTCFDFVVEYDNGSIANYHCEYYYNYKDIFELYLHDGTKLILVKNNLSNVIIDEVID